MDAKSKSKYYLSRSIFYSKSGDGQTVDADFNDLKKSIEALEFVTATADAEGVKLQKQRLRAHLVNTGSSLIDKSDYDSSSNYFEAAYNLSPSDTIYLYYAASTSVSSKQYDRSLVLYEKLRALEFTGIEKTMSATNLETQKKESFDNEMLMNISIKAKTHANPVEEFSDSKFPEIIKNIALIYMQNGDNEKALEAFAVARAEDPDNMNLLLSEANLYYQMGNTLKFKELLELAVQKDPNNPELQYNLGVISSDIDDFENSKKYYLRAIELDSDYTNAYINLAALILSQEQTILDAMNSLGSSKADDRKYDQLKEKRNQMFLKAIPYLESAMSTRIATNESITFLNSKAKRNQVSNQDLKDNNLKNLVADVYFDGDEIQFKLQKAIAQLPRIQQLVFNMRYFDDIKYKDMSAILETSEGALKASYH